MPSGKKKSVVPLKALPPKSPSKNFERDLMDKLFSLKYKLDRLDVKLIEKLLELEYKLDRLIEKLDA